VRYSVLRSLWIKTLASSGGTSASGGVYPRFDNLRRSFEETGTSEVTEKEKNVKAAVVWDMKIGMQVPSGMDYLLSIQNAIPVGMNLCEYLN
jgi:hypothetical protein